VTLLVRAVRSDPIRSLPTAEPQDVARDLEEGMK
jgi:hypothetical protein